MAPGQISQERLNEYEFAGELALSGEVKPIRGALHFAIATTKAKRSLIITSGNARRGSFKRERGTFYGLPFLRRLCTFAP